VEMDEQFQAAQAKRRRRKVGGRRAESTRVKRAKESANIPSVWRRELAVEKEAASFPIAGAFSLQE